MAPTMDAPVVRLSRDGDRHLDVLKWGLIPYFTKDIKTSSRPMMPNARFRRVCDWPPPEAGAAALFFAGCGFLRLCRLT